MNLHKFFLDEFRISRAEARHGKAQEAGIGESIPLPPLLPFLTLAISFTALIVWVARSLWVFVLESWPVQPIATLTPLHGLLCTGVVLLMGLGLYWLRERIRWMYAIIELGFSATTAYYACVQFARERHETEWLLALAASLYVSVRGYDNMAKWIEQRKRAAGQ